MQDHEDIEDDKNNNLNELAQFQKNLYKDDNIELIDEPEIFEKPFEE